MLARAADRAFVQSCKCLFTFTSSFDSICNWYFVVLNLCVLIAYINMLLKHASYLSRFRISSPAECITFPFDSNCLLSITFEGLQNKPEYRRSQQQSSFKWSYRGLQPSPSIWQSPIESPYVYCYNIDYLIGTCIWFCLAHFYILALNAIGQLVDNDNDD